jgi:hypothetical protein
MKWILVTFKLIKVYQGRPGNVGTTLRLTRRPLKLTFFKILQARTGLAPAKIADSFRRILSRVGLFQWRLSAPYRLAHRAASRLDRNLVRPWRLHKWGTNFDTSCIMYRVNVMQMVWYWKTARRGALLPTQISVYLSATNARGNLHATQYQLCCHSYHTVP